MRDIPGQAGPMVRWPHVEAMPGAVSALRALSALPVHCVATNAAESDREMVAAALDRVELRSHLTHFLTSAELGISKPSPKFYEEVARTLGMPAASLLAVGNDYVKDVIPAKVSGMMTVWLSAEEPSDRWAAADIIVPSLSVLAREIDGWDLVHHTDKGD